ncbi:hypothetical protein PPERSA_12532 [Pseudocohnilembus persalinus]|uniref:Uncharacterized protein n=1 Tax=Pseudocohnilembus persalinus TaxID=266149 RepID=A0A0V0QBJ2_PSEPJ|nr:hypothetical protein PPERSA_12532 [Pseudocohnilembus persalinus]|eukprot:KRW99428.1 hypothetical protein PPERSA_12532 [Pseudocohnilembus persalinus]
MGGQVTKEEIIQQDIQIIEAIKKQETNKFKLNKLIAFENLAKQIENLSEYKKEEERKNEQESQENLEKAQQFRLNVYQYLSLNLVYYQLENQLQKNKIHIFLKDITNLISDIQYLKSYLINRPNELSNIFFVYNILVKIENVKISQEICKGLIFIADSVCDQLISKQFDQNNNTLYLQEVQKKVQHKLQQFLQNREQQQKQLNLFQQQVKVEKDVSEKKQKILIIKAILYLFEKIENDDEKIKFYTNLMDKLKKYQILLQTKKNQQKVQKLINLIQLKIDLILKNDKNLQQKLQQQQLNQQQYKQQLQNQQKILNLKIEYFLLFNTQRQISWDNAKLQLQSEAQRKIIDDMDNFDEIQKALLNQVSKIFVKKFREKEFLMEFLVAFENNYKCFTDLEKFKIITFFISNFECVRFASRFTNFSEILIIIENSHKSLRKTVFLQYCVKQQIENKVQIESQIQNQQKLQQSK